MLLRGVPVENINPYMFIFIKYKSYASQKDCCMNAQVPQKPHGDGGGALLNLNLGRLLAINEGGEPKRLRDTEEGKRPLFLPCLDASRLSQRLDLGATGFDEC